MDKIKNLESTISQIERSFGKGSVMRLGQSENIEIETVPSGSISLDLALGIGGLQVKQHWHCTQLPRPRKKEVLVLLLMLNML